MTDRSVSDLLAELTLEEKVALTHGASDPSDRATGYVAGVERLDVPSLRMVDGPLGVRVPGEEATAFPAPLALAATFDTDLAEAHGAALGRETNGMGMDALLGPGTNLIRVPENGRNFEYFSEDPAHSAAFAAAVTRGVESAGVIATPKHYVANNQELHRASVSADVSERALRELYLPSFRAAVDAGAGSVMSAYNGVNGTRTSDHARLLRDVLKGEWGFDGYVVSDWFGTEGAAAAADAGLDVEMPGVPMGEMLPGDADASDGPVEMPEEIARGMPDPASCERFTDALAERVRGGTVPESRLDDMAERVLRQMERIGRLDGSRSEGAVDTEEHRRLARRVAERATVLLKNDGVLPLADDAAVALVGPNVDETVLGGGGSSETTPVVESTPEDGLTARADGPVTVEYGLPPVAAVSMFDLLEGAADDGAGDDAPARDPNMDAALAAAAEADVAVVCVRDTTTEAMDRESLRLPGEQDELVEAVADAADRTAVVVNSSGPVELPWRDDVDAVVENWYPGQAHGDALAAVLYGDADPSGRLPVTFAPESAYPTSGDERRYPGTDGVVRYDEGVFVGYRHVDRAGVEPTYPFGHGESYADYEYVDAELADGTVRVTVENTSERDGREVVQVYVEPPAAPDRPVRELAGFASAAVPAGERVGVAVDLDERAFDRYVEGEGWTTPPGEYALAVGRSSRDARLELAVTR